MRMLIILMLFLPGFIYAQDSTAISLNLLDTIIPLKAERFVGIDSYGNVYSINGKTLYKKSGSQRIQFSDLRLGEISTVDLLNPLKITLFYAETNTAVILDNTLNEITRVVFNELENFRNVSHARTARDGQLWIFNTDLQRLELYDYRNNSIRSDFLPQPDNAVELASDFNTCWVLTDTTLYQYNAYGSMLYKTGATDLQHIAFYDEQLFLQKKDSLYIKAPNKPDFFPLKTRSEMDFQFYYKAGNGYLYRPDIISVYKLNLPKK